MIPHVCNCTVNRRWADPGNPRFKKAFTSPPPPKTCDLCNLVPADEIYHAQQGKYYCGKCIDEVVRAS